MSKPGPNPTPFWECVDKTESCWLWTRGTDPHGYGKAWDATTAQRNKRAHRLAWELCVGPILPGMNVCHSCDTPSCVRPTHLFLGTHADNVRDKVLKRRQARGESMGRVKLTEADVRIIRSRPLPRDYAERFAREFGVCSMTIRRVVSREAWGHV